MSRYYQLVLRRFTPSQLVRVLQICIAWQQRGWDFPRDFISLIALALCRKVGPCYARSVMQKHGRCLNVELHRVHAMLASRLLQHQAH